MRSVPAVALVGVSASVIAASTPAGSSAQWRQSAWPVASAQIEQDPSVPSSVVAPPLLSLALPGAGQHVLGQKRKWAYLAVEAAGWVLWAERRASAHDYEARYRDYAWEHARIQSGARVEGDFGYYESMSKWARSGAFDSDPASAGVQPELDPAAYNGSIWALASGIYLPPGPPPDETDPAYQSALAYYETRAYGTELLWAWMSPAEQQEYTGLIHESDHRFGQATTMLGVVIANHLLSAADAYLSARSRLGPARVRIYPAGAEGPAGGGAGGDWLVVLSVAAG